MTTLQAAPAIVCSVLGESQGRSMHFRGRLISQQTLSGTYRFAITKRGTGGTSTISQGGSFSASPHGETFVGSATLSIEQGATFDARLTLQADGRSVECDPFAGGKI